MKRFLLILVCIGICSLQFLVAQNTKTWTGNGGDNFWYTDSNWDPSGSPNEGDIVNIPAGTPYCELWSGKHTPLTQLNNYGELYIFGGKIYTNEFNNHGSFHSHIYDGKSPAIYGNTNKGAMVNNYGVFASGTQFDFSEIGEFHNHHILDILDESTNFNILINDGVIQGKENKLQINFNLLVNNGTVIGKKNNFTDGSGIVFRGDHLENNGRIYGGLSEQAKGGDIKLNVTSLNNTANGVIRGGNGKDAENHGKIVIISKTTINKGIVEGGTSSSIHPIKTSEIYFNDISCSSDSIFLSSSTLKIQADTLRFVFDYLKISDLENYGSLYADQRIEFLSTENGILDLSENNAQYALSCANYNGIHVYCNNIISPQQGIAYIADVPVNTHPANPELWVNGSVYSKAIGDSCGASGAFYAFIKNLGTGISSFSYNFSSAQGWLESIQGITKELNPFDSDSILIQYSCPLDPDIPVDTVFMQISSGEFLLENTQFFDAYPQNLTNIEIRKNEKEQLLTAYPNPFSEQILLQVDLDGTLCILDSSGRIIFTKLVAKNQSFYWNPSDFSPGIYHILVQGPNQIRTKKIVKLD